MTRMARDYKHRPGRERGSAILEFAISLPLLVVFLVGIYDFSGAFTQKQKIAQAAQEGAIIVGAQPMGDIYCCNPNPTSLQPAVTAIFKSLADANVLPLARQGSCAPPGAVQPPRAGVQWIYTISQCPDDLVITINRGWLGAGGTQGSPASVGTVVTVSYPYRWKFNSVIPLLAPGAQYAATTNLSVTATVHNQS